MVVRSVLLYGLLSFIFSSCDDTSQEISVEEYFTHYQDRYDIEHFFRFGKNNLLMDQYQTPETKHEEAWWKPVVSG